MTSVVADDVGPSRYSSCFADEKGANQRRVLIVSSDRYHYQGRR